MNQEHIQDWRTYAESLGFRIFLSPEDSFEGCVNTGKRWLNEGQIGLYFWLAENGETYVGQSVRPRSRLQQHLKTHPDMVQACFQEVPVSDLDTVEADLIRRVNQVFPTRNIKHAFRSEAHVPFDDFITASELEAHLRGDWIEDEDDVWRDLHDLERKQASRFRRFSELPTSRDILRALYGYVWSVIPRPKRLEARFWSVSLFPAPHILRVNVGHQEAFTIQRVENGQLCARIFTAKAQQSDGGEPLYESKSFENVIWIYDLFEWLEGERLRSARELAVRLMRHTTALNTGSHAPQLVRAAEAILS